MQPFPIVVCTVYPLPRRALDSTKLGAKLWKVVITALFFAHLLLLSKREMNKLIRIVSKFCMDMHMKLKISKTYLPMRLVDSFILQISAL